jgi:hypothetical protein
LHVKMAEQITDAPAPGEHVVVGTDPESGVLTTYAFKHRDSTLFPAIRIKKIMLADSEVGKIKKESPALLALCVEMFIEQLINAAAGAAQADGAKLLSAGHLKRVVVNNPKWDFIQQLVEKIADLPEPAEGEAPKRTRRKKESADDSYEEPKIKKSGAKRASATPKRGKKKDDDISTSMDVAEADTAAMPENAESHASGPVFVDVSLSAPSVQAPPAISTAVDEDDFDA